LAAGVSEGHSVIEPSHQVSSSCVKSDMSNLRPRPRSMIACLRGKSARLRRRLGEHSGGRPRKVERTMSSRVYRPLAALLLGLLFGGLVAWFTIGPGDDDAPGQFALIYARCANSTAEAQRKVGITDPSDIRFAVTRQCATSAAAYAREFRAFSRCVEWKIKQLKALPARHIRLIRKNANYEPFTLRIASESDCSGISRPGEGDLWDDMFWQTVRTTPSGRPVPLR
jgi:hypothetical protein